jgi:hypothetical protein
MNRGIEATSPSFVRGCVNVLRKAIRRLHRTNRDVPELRWELAEIFGRIEGSRTEEIRSIDSWTRNEAEELVRITNRHEPRYDTRRSLYASGRAPGLDRSLEGAVNPQLFLDDVSSPRSLFKSPALAEFAKRLIGQCPAKPTQLGRIPPPPLSSRRSLRTG